MEKVQYLNCNKLMIVDEIKKGTDVVCECGCHQRCLDTNDHISRWRVLNPFSFEDKRYEDCSYDCINKLNDNIKDKSLSIELLNKDELHIDYSACRCGAFEEVIKINYCPICGKKLTI